MGPGCARRIHVLSFFSRMVGPSGKVYAFEPDDHTYEYLLRNIESHQLENVIPVKRSASLHKLGQHCSAWTEASELDLPTSPILPISERFAK